MRSLTGAWPPRRAAGAREVAPSCSVVALLSHTDTGPSDGRGTLSGAQRLPFHVGLWPSLRDRFRLQAGSCEASQVRYRSRTCAGPRLS